MTPELRESIMTKLPSGKGMTRQEWDAWIGLTKEERETMSATAAGFTAPETAAPADEPAPKPAPKKRAGKGKK